MAVVVAHLHGFGKALRCVATRARRAGLLCHRVVLYIPGAPVQRGFERYDLVAGRKTQQARVIHFGRVDDALRAQQVVGVQVIFNLRESSVDFWAKLPLNPFAPAQAITMLATVGPFVMAYQGRGLFGNRTHLGGTSVRASLAHVQNRPHMQRADRFTGIPGAFAAVFPEDFGQRAGVFGQMRQRHGAVFNKAHRLAIALQAHHDVQAGFADFPQVFLRCIVNHFNHGAGQAQIAHQLYQLFDFGQQISLGMA